MSFLFDSLLLKPSIYWFFFYHPVSFFGATSPFRPIVDELVHPFLVGASLPDFFLLLELYASWTIIVVDELLVSSFDIQQVILFSLGILFPFLPSSFIKL
jgi:hypothetical protein